LKLVLFAKNLYSSGKLNTNYLFPNIALMFRKCIAVAVFLLFSFASNAQIVGLTSAKVNSFTASPIAKHYAELEPSYGSNVSSSTWDGDGNLLDNPGPNDTELGSGMCIRSAYVLTDKLEVACMVPTTVDGANFSLKYFLGGDDKNGFAIITGIKVPMGNKTFNKDQRTLDEAMAFGLGTIYSRAFSETLSLDINLQYYDYLHSTAENHKSDIYLYADIGKYFADGQYQFLNGIGYAAQSFDDANSNVFSWYPGFSIEVNPNLLFVMNLQLDLLGKNAPKTFGFGFAATMTIPKP